MYATCCAPATATCDPPAYSPCHYNLVAEPIYCPCHGDGKTMLGIVRVSLSASRPIPRWVARLIGAALRFARVTVDARFVPAAKCQMNPLDRYYERSSN